MKAEDQIRNALNSKGYGVKCYQYSQPVWAPDGPEGGYFIELDLTIEETNALEPLNIKTHGDAGDNLRHLTYFEDRYLIGYKKEWVLRTIGFMPPKPELKPTEYENAQR